MTTSAKYMEPDEMRKIVSENIGNIANLLVGGTKHAIPLRVLNGAKLHEHHLHLIGIGFLKRIELISFEEKPKPTGFQNLENKRVLRLTLKEKAFSVMVTGEKKIEYRIPSEWIVARLKGREYDLVLFENGYGKHRPYFVAEYKGWKTSGRTDKIRFSNRLTVEVTPDTVEIMLGDIVETGNLKEK